MSVDTYKLSYRQNLTTDKLQGRLGMRKEIIKRNIILLFIVCLYVESIIVCAKGTIKNGTEKTKYGEYIYEDGALMAVRRNNYGILAKNVNECKVSTGGYGSSVFVKKSGKKNYVYEIGLKRNLFPKHIISQKAAEFYPIGNERIILADKNKKFIYRGEGRCFFLYTHKTEKECVASSGFCKKEKVLRFSLVFAFFLSAVLTGICYLFANQIVSVFLTDTTAFGYAVQFSRILLTTSFLFGVFYVLTNALQAMGAATEALVINVSRQGIIFIPALFILKAVIGMTGLVWAQPVADIVSLIIAYVLYVNTSKKMSV